MPNRLCFAAVDGDVLIQRLEGSLVARARKRTIERQTMAEVFLCNSAELGEGARKLIANGSDQIGVIRAGGVLHAFRNVCPHQGGPVCEGLIVHKVEEVLAEDKTYQGMRFSEDVLHIVCPWHGWEFNIGTGRCAGDGKHALKRYQVIEHDNGIYVVV